MSLLSIVLPKGFTFRNIRWGEFAAVILFVFASTFFGALKAGHDTKSAAVASVLPTYLAAVAYLRNPRALPWAETAAAEEKN